MYTIVYSYFNLYNSIIKKFKVYPLNSNFYASVIETTLLHELRHVYQYENGMRGNTLQEKMQSLPDDYDYNSDPMEIDAYKVAYDILSENEPYFSNICQKQVEMFINMIYSEIGNIAAYDKYIRY